MILNGIAWLYLRRIDAAGIVTENMSKICKMESKASETDFEI